MVGKILSSFNRETSGVYQAALLIGLSSILAKLLALYRDRLLAGSFGAGEMLDIYFAAFRVPDFLYSVSLIIATNVAIMPILMRKENQGHDEVRTFISQISSLFILAVGATILAAFFLMPYIASLIAPGFSAVSLDKLVVLSRILLLSPLLLGFSALVSGVLQIHNRFFIYALSPILYNAGIISGILFFYPKMGLSGLAWGVILGALLHFLIQVPSLITLGVFPTPTFRIFSRDIFEVFKFSLPRSMGLGFNQIVLIALTAIASAIGAGSIAIFQLAYNLFGIPLGVIGLSYSVAAFPAMARSFVDGKKEEFVEGVVSSLRHIIFWSLPFVVFFIVLRAHIVRVILGAGFFSWADTRLTAAALGLFSVSILAQGIVLLLVRAFYAAGRTALPLVVNAISSLITIAMAFGALYVFEMNTSLRLFEKSLLRVEDLAQTSVLVLAISFSVGNVINAVLLWLGFNRSFKTLDGTLLRSTLQNAAAALILGGVSYGVLRLTDEFFNLQTFLGVFFHGVSAATAGLFLALIYLWFSGNREMRDIAAVFRHKFWKSEAIAPEPRSAVEG
ncbi:MAG: lipid II flippase MurJ [Patescibacteria group bacterium]